MTSSKSDTHDSKDLKDDWNVDEWYNDDHEVEEGGSTINSTTLRNQIKKHVVVKPVTFDNLRGRLDFAEFNTNSFRINFYNHFINSIQNHKFFRASLQNEMYYLKPLITGVYLNLRNRPELRFWNLDLSPVRLKIDQHSGFLSEFQELMDAHHNSKPVIPFKLPASSVLERDSLDDFLKIKGSIQEQEGQREYISRLIINIESLMKNLFYKFYQSNGFQESNSQVWLDSMKNSKEVREEFASTTDKIRDLFQMFVSNQGFLNPKLKEVQKGLHRNLSSSDLAIIFLWAIDQAIANLPWDNANVFMMKMLEEIIDEPALSTRSEFAEFAFKTEESPLSPLTVEYVTQLLEGNDLIRDKVPELERNHAGFGDRCEYLLIPEEKK